MKEFRTLPDQLTGKDCWRHTRLLEIPDYPIAEQWVSDEVFDHPLVRMVREAGTVEALHQKIPQFSEADIVTALMLVRCQHDPWFAFATCFKIKHKTTGDIVPFIVNKAQNRLLTELEGMRIGGMPVRLVLLKARQWGGSTLVQLYMAWVQLFVIKGWSSVILAQTKDTARRIKAMYRTVLKHFPADILGVDQLTFAPYEGSSADSVIANGDGEDIRGCAISIASFENFESVRGASFSMAHYSEVAYWTDTPSKSAAQVITNIDGGISYLPLTIEVMESTANGMSGYFFDEYQSAKRGMSSYKAMFIPFFEIEHDSLDFADPDEQEEFARQLLEHREDKASGSDTAEPGSYLWSLWEKGATLEAINWYVQKRKGFHSHDQMASEAPADDRECFRYSGANVFPVDVVEREREQFASVAEMRGDISMSDGKPRIVEQTDGALKIWRHPDKLNTSNQYVVAVDVGGRSDNADYSVMTVINRLPAMVEGGRLEVVARWRGHLRYDLMAWKAVALATLYKNALLVFESNTFDLRHAMEINEPGVGDHIQGILYEISAAYRNLYYRRSTDEEDIKNGVYQKIGFQTNVKTKQAMVDHFIVQFEDGKFLDPDDEFYREASIYQQFPDGHYGNIPGRGNHDDILMSDMIGCLVSRDMPDAELVVQRPHTETDFTRLGTINESFI